MALPVSGASPRRRREIAATEAEMSGKLKPPSSLNNNDEDPFVAEEEVLEIAGERGVVEVVVPVGEDGCFDL